MRALKIAGAAIARRGRRHRAAAGDRHPVGLPDGADPGAGRARDRLQARHQWRRQDRPVAIAQHHAERRHAAASEGPRHQPPLRGRKHRGGGDARQPVGRQAAYHRARHHPPGGEFAAAARAREGGQSCLEARCRQGDRCLFDRAYQRHRRHHRALQPARPRREQDRDRQCRHHHRFRPQGRADRQRPPQRLSAEIRDQGGAARSRRSSGRISRPRSRSTRPTCCTPRSRPRPKPGSTAPS